jgi:hypothetical protein
MQIRPLYRFLAALLAALPIAAHAAAPAAVIQLEPYRSTVGFHAEIGGRAGFFVFDTGAGITTLHPEFAAATGCRQRQRLVGYLMMGQRFETPYCEDQPMSIGAAWRGTLPTANVWDIMQAFDKDAKRIDGIVGLDIFAGRTLTIDFPARRLILESADSARERMQPAREVPLRISRELQGRTLSVSVGVPTPEGPVWMELDSGNGGTLLVSKPYAHLFGLKPDVAGFQQGTIPVAGNLVARSERTMAKDMIIDGNLGMPFLKNVVLTLDLAAGRAWMVEAPAR